MKRTINLIDCYDKQLEVWESTNKYRYTIVATGRQCGKSTLAMARAFHWAITEKRSVICYFLPTYDQIRDILNRIKSDYKEVMGYLKCEMNLTNKTIYFPRTESYIYFKSSNAGDGGRGKPINHIICDESAFIPDDVWQTVIKPSANAAGISHLIVSTPKRRNWFYELFQLGRLGKTWINSITFTSYDSPFCNTEEIESSRESLPEPTFRQEYLAEFSDGAGLLFQDFESMLYPEQEMPNRQRGANQVYFGIDLGKEVDYSICMILDQHGNLIDRLKVNKASWTVIAGKIRVFLNRWAHCNPIGYLETNGVGNPLWDMLVDELDDRVQINKWNTNSNSKQRIIEALVNDFEKKLFRFPNFHDLKRELLTFEQWIDNGRIKYGAPVGEHDDQIIALALARYSYHSDNNTNTNIINRNTLKRHGF